ncbi:MAG: LCCL domain-containing protein [Pirellulales bacterium]
MASGLNRNSLHGKLRAALRMGSTWLIAVSSARALALEGLIELQPPPAAAAPAAEAQQAPAAAPADAKPAETATKEIAAAAANQPKDRFDIRSSDGSMLKVRLLDEKIPLQTEFGKLLIPAAEIRQIDFATRVAGEIVERTNAAIEKLGAEEYATREAASAELLSLGANAYAALTKSAKSEDPEVARRSELLLERIRKDVPEELLQARTEDVVYTDKSQIAGTIDLPSLNVETALFGNQQLTLVHLRHLSTGLEEQAAQQNVLADPGTLTDYREKIGQTFFFKVQAPRPGMQPGAVWGTDIYTYDSHLGLAAVHAGAALPGESKVVGVRIVGPQATFAGSVRNGVPSANWGEYPSGFAFVKENEGPQQRLRVRGAIRAR